jgi:hypothetical protein
LPLAVDVSFMIKTSKIKKLFGKCCTQHLGKVLLEKVVLFFGKESREMIVP